MIDIDLLTKRAAIIRSIRRFFDDRGYLAAETPNLAERPIPEAHIELFRTEFVPPEYKRAEPRALFLLPSPEYYLKRLIAAGSGSLYEITHSFRNAESVGHHHNPEFTMLEYYTVDADGDDSIAITIDLLRALGVTAEPLILTMEEAFQRYAGRPLQPLDVHERAGRSNEESPNGESPNAESPNAEGGRAAWEERFQRDFLNLVEPELPKGRPVFLTRYPAAVPTLARTIPGTSWADRWELYLGGIEVANCFGEETSPERIRSFFRSQQDHKERDAIVVHPIDDAYLGTDAPLPRCSGVALGVDRLCMYLLGVDDIERVISFPLFR